MIAKFFNFIPRIYEAFEIKVVTANFWKYGIKVFYSYYEHGQLCIGLEDTAKVDRKPREEWNDPTAHGAR
uniref:Uncharacterized protein n=1 Tax=Steinernema glaseri TaxID=37863 RepID=A0A1I7Y1W8_9BILA